VDSELMQPRRQPARESPHEGRAEARGVGRLLVEPLPRAGGGGVGRG
jgi:hypothetical protein